MERKKYRSEVVKIIKKNIIGHIKALACMLLNSGFIIISTITTKSIYDYAIPSKNLKILLSCIVIYVITVISQVIFQYVAINVYIKMGNDLVYQLRCQIIRKLVKMGGKFYSTEKAGDLISITYEDTSLVKNLTTISLYAVISDIITAIPLFIYILTLQRRLLLILFLLQPLFYFVQKRFDRIIFAGAMKCRKAASRYSVMLQEMISNFILIISIGCEQFVKKKTDMEGLFLKKNNIKLEKTIQRKKISMSLVSVLVNIFVLGYGGYVVIKGDLTIGGLMIFLQYSGKIFSPLLSLSDYRSEYIRVLPSYERIYNLLNTTEEIDIVEDKKAKESKKDVAIKIQFSQVHFSYKDKLVLKNLNFTIEPKGVTAIVGESGSGKSTIINLILKLWKCDNGKVLINGINVNDICSEKLHRNIGVVTQTSFIFNDTIRENILLDEEFIDEKEIQSVLDIVELRSFVDDLPDGLDTIVGDKGITLSGGQRQRIELARLLLRKTPVLILDESTSSLDKLTESKILNKLISAYPDKSIILITHRLESITNISKIIVLNNGEIAESGTHLDLMQKKGIYYCLYENKQLV